MVAGFRGADRDAENRSDFGQGHPEVVVQDNDRAPFGLEPPKGQIQQLAVGEETGGVRHRRLEQHRNLDLDRSTTTASQDIDTGSNDETAQPGIEPIRVPKGRKVPPGCDESVLDRVSRELGISEDQAGGGVEPCDGHAGKLSEGVMIALPRPFHESSLVHAISHRGAASLDALRMVCRRDRDKGSRSGHSSLGGAPSEF